MTRLRMKLRRASPSIGRFISEDPAPDGANWYAYCRNNPVNAVDPDGKQITREKVINWVADMGGYTQAALYLAAVAAYLTAHSAILAVTAANLTAASYANPGLKGMAALVAGDALLLGIAAGFVGAASAILTTLGAIDEADAAGFAADYLTSATSAARLNIF